ncbi:hypothetical protein DWX78_15025 [Dorea formicigenerans]|uniref:Uncharacterized protein n=1 Tax=Dorea formicigenerans TaxID=39486 RepID=A0A412KDF2_9FIRM|nr:hypothetical protein DWX78_15025 [Dorea formicigenerans]
MVEIFAKEPSQDDRVTLRIFIYIGQKNSINNAMKLSIKKLKKWLKFSQRSLAKTIGLLCVFLYILDKKIQ